MRHPPPAGSRRRAIPCNPPAPPLRGGATAGPALTPASSFPAIPNPPTIPLPFREGAGDRSKPHHTWHYPCGFGPSGGRSARPPARRGDHRGASPPPPLHMVERGPGGEARNPPRPLSFPHPPLICTTDGDWQLQVLPGAPGTARQGPTRTIMLVNSGGIATQPRAPGHERPRAAQRAARHGRLSAATRAPGADVPLATTAGAPGQYCLSAAPRAPGHGKTPAAQRAARHDRLSADLPAPDDDAPLAATASLSSHHRPSAASIATVSLPAGLRRLRQECLPRVPANPRTLIYPHSHRDTAHTRAAFSHTPRYAQSRESRNPPLSTWWRGAGGEGRHLFPLSSGKPQTTHQAHPAIQVPPHPRSCSTADTGFPCHRCRAPPQPPAENLSLPTAPPSPHGGEGPGVRTAPTDR